MKRIRGLRFGLVGAAAVVVVLIGVLMLAGNAAAQGGATLTVTNGAAEQGEEGTVSVDAGDVGGPGLGAWTVDVAYDTSVITAVDCSAEKVGVCNAEFATDTVRITGASAGGLEGDTTLGGITFECVDARRSSALTLTISVFADATIGDPQDIDATVINGAFECGPRFFVIDDGYLDFGIDDLGDLGTGPAETDGSNFGWLIAVLAVVGTAGLVVGFGARRSH